MCFGKKLKRSDLKTFIKNNSTYLFPYLMVVAISVYYLLQFDKLNIHIEINKLVGNPVIDNFFKYFTHVGDGVVAVSIGLVILALNIRNGIYILSTFIVSGLTTSMLKNFMFHDVNRPHFIFGFYFPNTNINYVEGVNMMGLYSFPSGHSTSSFAVFTSLALLSANRYLKFFFFIVAFLSAFSRTYLSQHWLVDITAGSIIGTITAIAFYYIFIQSSKFQTLNRPLFNTNKN
jgi:membrane-associated phospholipid phosphatase